jgi:hypothetical protein
MAGFFAVSRNRRYQVPLTHGGFMPVQRAGEARKAKSGYPAACLQYCQYALLSMLQL